MSGGERCDRCRWQMKGAERVAAVGVQRSRTVGKAHTGHRNRTVAVTSANTGHYLNFLPSGENAKSSPLVSTFIINGSKGMRSVYMVE